LRYAYLGFNADGGVLVTVTDDSGASEAKQIASVRPGQQSARVALSRSLGGRYWTLRVGNRNGADFSIDSIAVLTISRSLGIGQR
jgi:hypothetical protein